jgi:DNA-binding NarL/FixJ family response regulator
VTRVSEGAGLGAFSIPRTAAQSSRPAQQRIIFLASRQAVYQCLSQATQKHFSAYEVTFVDPLLLADLPDASAVRLVLLGCDQGGISINCVTECRRRFPSAAIGLVIDRVGQDIDQNLIVQRLVQGILPLTLPLDVWLAIVSLLVAGGEYLSFEATPHADAPPPRLPHERPAIPGDGEPLHPRFTLGRPHPFAVPPPRQARKTPGRDPVLGIESLTARERQILQLVSEGYQNKLIADLMSLSEHTVKAHVHNLIAKLRVTNRTQAAAAFLHGNDAVPVSSADIGVGAELIALQGR